jgi:hypothetical protein
LDPERRSNGRVLLAIDEELSLIFSSEGSCKGMTGRTGRAGKSGRKG